MKFIIGNTHILLSDYKELNAYIPEYKVCREIIDFLDKWLNDEIDAFEFKTSGSTGIPKIIKHFRTSMIVSAQITQNAFGYTEGETALLCLPVQYISGCMMLVRSIVSNLDLIISDVSTFPLQKVELACIDKIDFAPMTPMQFENLYNKDVLLIEKFKNILLGGAQVNNNQLLLIIDVIPNVFIGYGMTETITHLALKKLNNNHDTCYKVLNGFEVSQNDADCLVISANHLHENVVTNDIVDLISSDQFVWKGRLDNIINSGGLKVNPEELENIIGRFLTDRFFITSIADEIFGEKVVLVVEKNDFDSENNKDVYINKVKKYIKSIDLGNKKPRLLFLLSSFVLTANGKLDSNAIKASLNLYKSIPI